MNEITILKMEKLIKRIKEYKDFVESKKMEHCDDGIFIYYDDLQPIIDMYENDKIIEETLHEQVKYIEIVEKVKESLSKILFSGGERKIGLANDDMDHGALVAYEDIYNFISELEHEVDND